MKLGWNPKLRHKVQRRILDCPLIPVLTPTVSWVTVSSCKMQHAGDRKRREKQDGPAGCSEGAPPPLAHSAPGEETPEEEPRTQGDLVQHSNPSHWWMWPARTHRLCFSISPMFWEHLVLGQDSGDCRLRGWRRDHFLEKERCWEVPSPLPGAPSCWVVLSPPLSLTKNT